MPSWVSGVPNASGFKLKAEIDFDSAPSVPLGSATWTDVTADLRSFEIHRGRPTNFDSYQPGTLSMVLGNRDRDYDPNHSTGPHFGKLLPRKRVRISAAYNSSFVAWFTGYIEGWPQTYELNTRDATVTLNATDGYAALQGAVLTSLYEYEVRKDAPQLWIRFGDTGTIVDSSPSQTGGLTGAVGDATVDGLLVGSAHASFFFAGNWAVVEHIDWPPFPFTIEFWMNSPGDVITPTHEMIPVEIDAWAGGPSTFRWIRFRFASTGMTCQFSDTASSFDIEKGFPGAAVLGTPNHFAVTMPSATSMTIYFNGVSMATGGPVFGTPVNLGQAAIILSRPIPGAGGLPTPAAGTVSFVGALDEFAVYPTALSTTRLRTHWSVGTSGTPDAQFGVGNGAPSGTQINKILDMAGWPAADRIIDAGVESIVLGDTTGKTALELIQAIERTEQGHFYIDAYGNAVFHDRNYLPSLTSAATFGDSGTELRYSDIALDESLTFVRNKITATSITGNSFTVSDPTSITNYLECGETLDGLLFDSDIAMRDMVNRRLLNFSNPRQRITKLEVKPRRDLSTLGFPVRDLTLLSPVTVLHRPQSVGAPISQDVQIEGLSYSATANLELVVNYFLSPDETSPGDGTYYLVFDDPVRGLWGSNRWA